MCYFLILGLKYGGCMLWMRGIGNMVMVVNIYVNFILLLIYRVIYDLYWLIKGEGFFKKMYIFS